MLKITANVKVDHLVMELFHLNYASFLNWFDNNIRLSVRPEFTDTASPKAFILIFTDKDIPTHSLRAGLASVGNFLECNTIG